MKTRSRSCLAILLALVCGVAVSTAQGFKFLEVKVVDSDGKPMPDVPVDISIGGMEFPMPTNEDGIVSINIPAGEESELELGVGHEGYAAVKARWAKGNKIPEQFTIPLRKGKTIGGIVHDEDGKPVEGVKIEAIATAYDDNDINAGKGELQMSIPRDLAVTDSEGRWQTNSAPPEDVALQMRLNHPDYVNDRGFNHLGTWEELQSLQKIVVIQKGIAIAGTVTDGDQKPIEGAKLSIGERWDSQRAIATSDEDGSYRFPNLQPGSVALTVVADGFAPDLKTVSVSKDMGPVDFQLDTGKTVRLRIVDKSGLPVAGVRVIPDEWRGTRSIEQSEQQTDEQGLWQWTHAPADEIKYNIWKSGHMQLRPTLTASDEEQLLTMLPAVVVNGKVTDKATGEPIHSFKFVEGVWWEPNYDSYVLQSHNVQVGKDGEFRFQMESACEKFCVRVEADGYRPLVSREIMPDEGEIGVAFELEKGSGPHGVVLTPEGEPAVGAEVVMATPGRPIYIENGFIQQSTITKAITDAEGQFALPVPEDKCKIVVLHKAGWLEYEPSQHGPEQLVLIPWSRIVGKSLRGNQPVEGEMIRMDSDVQFEPNEPYVGWDYREQTRSSGEFEFNRVKPGQLTIQRQFRYADTGRGYSLRATSHGVSVSARAGQTHKVQIGGSGQSVKGHLVAEEKAKSQIDWNMGAVLLSKKPGTKEMVGSNLPGKYATLISPDGTFEIFDVAPGNYELQVGVHSVNAPENNWNEIALLKQPCTVPEEAAGKPIDLGTLTVPLVSPQTK